MASKTNFHIDQYSIRYQKLEQKTWRAHSTREKRTPRQKQEPLFGLRVADLTGNDFGPAILQSYYRHENNFTPNLFLQRAAVLSALLVATIFLSVRPSVRHTPVK